LYFQAKRAYIHAIGAGVVLCEIQQFSDVTYRIYDYGRPRELHLQKAMDVVDLKPYTGKAIPVALSDKETRLVSCPYFTTDGIALETSYRCSGDPESLQILIAIEGQGWLANEPFHAGMAWAIPPGEEPFLIEPDGKTNFLRTSRLFSGG
jgi:mannose-6-phosphate isomerase